jgi:hypothetical protein
MFAGYTLSYKKPFYLDTGFPVIVCKSNSKAFCFKKTAFPCEKCGLAGVIARKGGQKIQEECNKIGPIKIGEAAITTAGNLPAKYVIHAASMRLGGRTSSESLASSVQACLDIAEKYKLESIAFPAIGTGIARFPIEQWGLAHVLNSQM